jgi:hypothetical protein
LYLCSTTPFFLGIQKVENCLAISCDSQNSWIHFRYIHIDFHIVISLVYFLRMCFNMCFIKLNIICNTYDFILMKQALVYIDISSINKTKYQTSPCVCVCVGPYIKMNKPQQHCGPCSSIIWKCTLILFSHQTSKLHNGKLVNLASNPVTDLSCCNFCSVRPFKCSICWAIWLHLKLYCHQWWKESIVDLKFPSQLDIMHQHVNIIQILVD